MLFVAHDRPAFSKYQYTSPINVLNELFHFLTYYVRTTVVGRRPKIYLANSKPVKNHFRSNKNHIHVWVIILEVSNKICLRHFRYIQTTRKNATWQRQLLGRPALFILIKQMQKKKKNCKLNEMHSAFYICSRIKPNPLALTSYKKIPKNQKIVNLLLEKNFKNWQEQSRRLCWSAQLCCL